MEPLNITREWVAQQLVEKHEKALKVIKEEFEKYSSLEQGLDKAAETYKTDRDKLNDRVQKLKEQRQDYYKDSRALRKEFMTKIDKKKSMADIPMEVLILTKQIDQLEWEIQTEAVNIDDEKRLVKHIQNNLDKLHDYANKYQEHEEVSKAVKKLTSNLNKKLTLGRKMHDEMLKSVSISDEKHKNFVEAVVKLRDARAKRVGFQHDLEKHQKAIEHWKKLAGTGAKTDTKPGPEKPSTEPKAEASEKTQGQEASLTEPKEPKEPNKPNNESSLATGGNKNGQ